MGDGRRFVKIHLPDSETFASETPGVKFFTKWRSGGCQPNSEPVQTPAFSQWFNKLN